MELLPKIPVLTVTPASDTTEGVGDDQEPVESGSGGVESPTDGGRSKPLADVPRPSATNPFVPGPSRVGF